MDSVIWARSLFGSSMAFHIIFATMGVGLPTMIILAEVMYQWKKDEDYALLAKRWTRGFGILLGVAIPSGTIVGVMIALLWPGFMEIVGEVIALPFQIEIWAFFLEALFMAIYVYAADRLSASMRIISLVLVSVGATGSGVLITDAHSWMNTPSGFRIENGAVVDVHPWLAVFNPSFLTTSLHVVSSAYMTGAFAIASVAAYKLLRKKRSPREMAYHRKALFLTLIIGGSMSVLTAVNGHATAQMLHRYQPEKLAGAEGLFETRSYAPLTIGGFTSEVEQGVKYGIEIPWALSFLAGNHFDTVVKGLNEFPRENWPPLYIHTLFNLMVGIGSLLIVLAFVALALKLWWKKHYPRWLLWLLLLSGPMSMVGIETGWIFSCTGRQPWTIYHIQRTSEAAIQSNSLLTLFIMFISLYVFLMFVTIFVLRFYFGRNPVAKELT